MKHLILSFSFLLFFSCNNFDDQIDSLSNRIDELLQVQSLLELKNIFLNSKANEILISKIEDENNLYHITFENGKKYLIEKKYITTISKNPEDWILNIVFSDLTEMTLFYVGNKFKFDDIILNPYNISPLTLIINKKTPVKGKFTIKVIGQDGPQSDFIIDSKKITDEHQLKVFGLYPGFKNNIEISFLDKNNNIRTSTTIEVNTDKLPPGFPEISVEKKYQEYKQNTLILVNYRPTHMPFMVDPHGKVRWFTNGFTAKPKYGLQLLKNGNFAYGVSANGQGKIYEISLTGKVIKVYDFYGKYENAHHDVYERGNGNFLVPVNRVGIDTIEDFIIEIDRNSSDVINEWDLRKILQTDRFDFRMIRNGQDWFHTNAVIEDETDNSIIISGQAQGVVKVTWDNQLKWILAPHDGWNSVYDNYLLNPLGDSFEWSWGQHAPQKLSNGNLMLFDNGFGREFGNSTSTYSRAVEYHIDESVFGGNISQVWQYGKERGEELFSPFISDVDYLEDSSTIFITSGSTAYDLEYDNINSVLTRNLDEIETRILEINYEKEIIFEMTFKSDNPRGTTYRAEKLTF